MKKIALLILMLGICLFSHAELKVMGYQSVKYLKLNDSGWEYMMEGTKFKTKEWTFNVYYQAYFEKNQSPNYKYYLILEMESIIDGWTIPSDGKLLLKTGKDDKISLVNNMYVITETIRYIPTFDCQTGQAVTMDYEDYKKRAGIIYHLRRARYELSADVVNKILSDGVVKLRVQTDANNIDITLPATEKFEYFKEKRTGNKFSVTLEEAIKMGELIYQYQEEN